MTSILKFKEKAFKEVRKSAVWLSCPKDDWLIDGCMLKLNPAKRRDFWLWPYSRLSNWIVGPLHIAWLVSPFVTPCMQFLPLLELLWLHVRPFTHSLAMFSVARYVTPGTPLWRSVDRSLFVGQWWSHIHFLANIWAVPKCPQPTCMRHAVAVYPAFLSWKSKYGNQMYTEMSFHSRGVTTCLVP